VIKYREIQVFGGNGQVNKDIFLKEDYRETTKSMSFLKANIVALIYPAPLAAIYTALYLFVVSNRWNGNGEINTFTLNFIDILLWLLFYFAAFFGLVVLHEFVHALFFLKGCDYGWKSIVFGIKSATPYCHCSEVISLRVYRQSLLAPLWAVCVPLAAVSMFTGNSLIFLLTISMIFGSGGDLAIFWMSRKHAGKTTYVWDMEDAVGCILYERITPAAQSEA
jgi:hypothetical protein